MRLDKLYLQRFLKHPFQIWGREMKTVVPDVAKGEEDQKKVHYIKKLSWINIFQDSKAIN